ncbi:MAG: hypothetical protein JWN93_3685, partial [Hyphomicrobiales bacterium]|nr:hypothetical protein [Hyphomicrobiales bacterium]
AGFFFAIFWAVYPTLSDWINRAPEIAASLQSKFSFLQRPFEQLSHLGNGKSAASAVVVQESDQTKVVASVLAMVTPALTQAIIFMFCLIFFLAGRLQFRNRVVLQFADRQDRLVALRTFSTIESSLLRYFATVTTINACLGVLTGLSMWLVGMEKPLVWGFLAFLVNFLPIVGPLLLKAFLLVGGLLLMPDIATGFIPVLVYLMLVTIEANYVTPTIVGTRFTVNPFLVFLSVVFWSWLWGFFGAFLAMPILVVATTIIDAVQRDEKVQIPG